MMRIQFDEVVRRDITLKDATVLEVTRRRLKELVHPGEFIREFGDKQYLKMDDPDWRHGSVSEVTIREATELDKAVFLVLKALK